MKTKLFLTVVMLIVITSGNLFAEKKKDIVPTYAGSKTAYDDIFQTSLFSLRK